MLVARGEGCKQGSGRDKLLGEPSYKLHGRGRNGKRAGDHSGRRAGGLRRKRKGHSQSACTEHAGGRKAARGPRNAEAQTKTYLVARIFTRAHVCFDGAHDVGLAAAGLLRRQPRGDGPDAAAAHSHHHGHQPALFHQRLQGPLAPRTQHGYARRPRLDRRICLQHLRPLCHDRRAGPGRYGRGHGLHDGLLL